MPAQRALSIILQKLLKVVLDNNEGVVGRNNEESLHDYRVAVRRTRSALSLFGALVPPITLRRSRRLFSDLGRRTNAARDLDVLLLEMPEYADRLPEDRAGGLASLRRELERQVAAEYAAIGRWLRGKTYHRSLETWRRDVSAMADPAATTEEAPIGGFAARATAKAASKAFEQAEKLEGKNPDEAIHRMRIRFKRLRYALEFSRSLYPGEEVESFIAMLKNLQNDLGVYQDLAVHKRLLVRLAGAPDAELARAGDWLVAEVEARQDRLGGEIRSDVPGRAAGLRVEFERVLASLDWPATSG